MGWWLPTEYCGHLWDLGAERPKDDCVPTWRHCCLPPSGPIQHCPLNAPQWIVLNFQRVPWINSRKLIIPLKRGSNKRYLLFEVLVRMLFFKCAQSVRDLLQQDLPVQMSKCQRANSTKGLLRLQSCFTPPLNVSVSKSDISHLLPLLLSSCSHQYIFQPGKSFTS